MKRSALRCIIFLVWMGLFLPFISKAQAPQHPAIPEGEVRQFIEEYTKRFEKLDLDPYMDLFSRAAIENRILPYGDIRLAYRKTIEGSQSLQMAVKLYIVQTDEESAFANGRYQITQILKNKRVRTFQGNIQWWLVREKGSLKIREINYGVDP